MAKRSRAYLEDIFESIVVLEGLVKEVRRDFSLFSQFTLVQDATLYRLIVVGEAVKHLESNFRRDHPEIPWDQIAGLRDVLVHEYFKVNVLDVWEVLTKDIPKLKRALKRMRI